MCGLLRVSLNKVDKLQIYGIPTRPGMYENGNLHWDRIELYRKQCSSCGLLQKVNGRSMPVKECGTISTKMLFNLNLAPSLLVILVAGACPMIINAS